MLEPAVPPVNDIDEIRRALAGTVLEGCEIEETPILDTGEVSFEIPFAADGDFSDARRDAAWNAARGLVDQLGRWPVVVGDSGDNLFGRDFYGEDGDTTPGAIVDASLDVFVPDAVDRRWAFEAGEASGFGSPWSATFEEGLQYTEERVGARPAPEQLVGIEEWDERALERVLLTFEESLQTTVDPERWDLVAPFENECGVVALLPTAAWEESPAYLHYWGAGESVERTAEFIATLRGWRRAFGAELRTSSSVALDLILRRPPATVFEAFEMATQYQLYARPGHHLRGMARALLGAGTVRLFERP